MMADAGQARTVATMDSAAPDNVNGWPYRDTAPATPDPAVRALLPWNPDQPAVAVSATTTTIEVWTQGVPSPAHVRAWEAATGRIVTVVLTSEATMAALAAARTSDTYTTGWDDLLTHIGATFGDLGTGPWPAAASVTVAAGRTAVLRTAVGRTVDISGGLWNEQRLAGLRADLGLTRAHSTVFAVDAHVRAVATGTPQRVHVRFKPATFPGVDAVGLPAGAADLTGGGPAVVAVGSAPGGGRTSLAVALAVHAAARTSASVAHIGDTPTWPATDGADWVTYPGPAIDAIADAVADGIGVLCVDNVASEAPGDPVWAAAGRAAAAGVTVIVTSAHARLDGLAATVAASDAFGAARGAVVRTLVGGDGETVTIDDTLVVTDDMRRWLTRNPGADLLYARDLHGHAAGHAYDTALGLAVSSGRLSADAAAAWVRHPDRYAAGGGQSSQPDHADAQGDWDWRTRTGTSAD